MFSKIILSLATVLTLAHAQQSYQSNGVKSHNNYRARHNAAALTWNNNLGQIAVRCAQYYANGGKSHTCNEVKGKYGENIAGSMSSGGAPSFDQASEDGIRRWYDENKGYNYDNPDQSRGVTGHFTQLVWKNSRQVGIGCASNSQKWTHCVAVYDPPGNYKGQYQQNVQRPS